MSKHVVWAVAVMVVAVIAFFIGKNGSSQAQDDKPTAEKTLKQDFAGSEKHEITFAEAKKLIQAERKKTNSTDIRGGTFNRAIIEKILAQPGCSGLCYFFARGENKKQTIVLVGVDRNGKEMLNGTIAEKSDPCPPYCTSLSMFE
jgi:hypothetical protein